MDDKKPEPPADFQSRVNLPDMNRQWIANQEQRGEERLEEIFRMNNIGLVLTLYVSLSWLNSEKFQKLIFEADFKPKLSFLRENHGNDN